MQPDATGSSGVPSLGIAPPIGLREPGRGRGIRRWLRRRQARTDLDSQLADGVDPRSTPALTARADQLTRMRVRHKLATGIERALSEADKPPTQALSAAIPVNRREIGPASLLLEAAAQRLRSSEPVTAEGIVLIARLLTDSASPLYNFTGRDQLTHAAALALRALYPR